ncbi:HdeD family acid-resistance protein [Microbacterium sp. 179-I 3D3 NHS]|uniref:HdeD family acid-resistance protein n=1 Tax=unclassified Microbacterium TaxID=2609290 RepID=UPI0039A38CC8
MSQTLSATGSISRSIRVALLVSGVIALIAGIVLLVWPVKSAVIVTAIFATYLIIAGLVYIGLGIFSGAKGGWSRVGHIVLGLVYIAAGVIAYANLGAAAAALAFVVVIFIGISWIVDGVVALSLLGQDGSRVWTLLYALLSIIAGIIVLFSPVIAGLAFWLLLGVSLVVLGIVQIVRGLTHGRGERVHGGTVAEGSAA